MTMAQHVIPDAMAADVTATVPASPPIPAALVATYDEIKSGCLGADAAFICSQLEAKATLAQAQAAWMAEQNRRVQQANERAEQASIKKPGVDPLPAGNGKLNRQVESDAVSAFEEAVVAEIDRTRASRHVAQRKVCTSQPELREAMVAAHNAQFGRARQ